MTLETSSGIWTTVLDRELQTELRSRRSIYEFKTVKSSIKTDPITDGWILDKKNKQSMRLKKPKRVGDALEDQIWTLMARMGFEEMNHGRQFRIPTGGDEKQIDVFAKDKLSCLIISCKANTDWAHRSLQSELESLDHLKRRIPGEVNKHYDSRPPHFHGFVLATKNVDWSPEDEERAAGWGIKAIKDEEIDYYTKLTDLIGPAARYQLMADLFSGQRIPKMRNQKVTAIKGRYKDTSFYQFVSDAETLATLSYVQHRAKLSREGEMSYQRLVSKSKLASIADYLNEDQIFPTNVVINFQNSRSLVFEPAGLGEQNEEGLTFGKLVLPDAFKSAWIIDGQHRLFSYFHNKVANPSLKTRKQLPVVAFENLDRETEAQMFVDINSKQTKVSRNLLLEIKSDIDINHPDQAVRLDAICTRIALSLNSERRSPLYNQITSEQSASSETSVTLTQIQAALKGSGIIATIDRMSQTLLPGPLYSKDVDSTIVRSVGVLTSYFRLFSEGAKEHWDTGNKPNNRNRVGGHLNSSRGVGALIYLLKSLEEFISKTHEDNFRNISPAEFVNTVSVYSNPVINYFKNPSYEDIHVFKRHRGSQAPINGMREMQKIINGQDSHFSPDGLAEYIENERQSLANDMSSLLNELLPDLTRVTVAFLKQKFPESEDWFHQGLSLAIKQRMLQVHDINKSRSLDQCFDMPTDAKTVSQIYKGEFESIFKAPDNKWLDQFIEIRNASSHQSDLDPLWMDYLEDEIKPLIANGIKSMNLV